MAGHFDDLYIMDIQAGKRASFFREDLKSAEHLQERVPGVPVSGC